MILTRLRSERLVAVLVEGVGLGVEVEGVGGADASSFSFFLSSPTLFRHSFSCFLPTMESFSYY